MKKSPNLHVQLAPQHAKGLALSNPVMIAAGIAGYGLEYAEIADIQKLGAIVCKGTTLRLRKGNAQPRLVETAGGVLNSVGLENIGVDALIEEIDSWELEQSKKGPVTGDVHGPGRKRLPVVA